MGCAMKSRGKGYSGRFEMGLMATPRGLAIFRCAVGG